MWVTRWQLRDQIAAGRWRPIGRSVVLHRGRLDAEQRRWVALAQVGQGAQLAGRTALSAAGLTRFETDQLHVLVRHGARAHPLGGVTAHYTQQLPAPVGSPARSPVCRAAVDAAAWSGSERTACALLAAVVQQRLADPAALQAELSRRQVRFGELLHRVVDDIVGGSQALSELDFVARCRRQRLPLPDRQVRRRDSRGRRRYLDAHWSLPGGRSLVVEIDGSVHLRPDTYSDDMFRGNDLRLDGDLVLRFSSVAVRLADPLLVTQLRRALGIAP